MSYFFTHAGFYFNSRPELLRTVTCRQFLDLTFAPRNYQPLRLQLLASLLSCHSTCNYTAFFSPLQVILFIFCILFNTFIFSISYKNGPFISCTSPVDHQRLIHYEKCKPTVSLVYISTIQSIKKETPGKSK